MLGRLKTRLLRRESGWGWVTLQGAPGFGGTRLLEETAAHLEEQAARPLWIRPARGELPPLEPLRRALASRVALAGPLTVRTLGALISRPAADLGALANWLAVEPVAAAGANERHTPRHEIVRDLIVRLVPAGPLLVDRFDLLDPACRAVLLPSADGRGPGVIATVHEGFEHVPEGTTWSVEPLAEAQAELLIRRWLKSTATARRLAPLLVTRYHGAPGRMVEAVRRMAVEGHLTLKSRGVTMRSEPRRWPDGRRAPDAFLRWARLQPEPTGGVLSLAILVGDPVPVDWVAETAGVKRRFVQELVEHAVAARDGARPGWLFATAASRRAALGQMRARDARSLAQELVRNAPASGTRQLALMAARLRLLAGETGESLAAIAAALSRDVRELEPIESQIIAEIFEDLSWERAEPEARLGVARRLVRAQAIKLAKPLVADLETESLGTDAGLLLLKARHMDAGEARRFLRERLPEMTGSHQTIFDAAADLAAACLRLGDSPGAREAWRHAARVLEATDVTRRARWHRGLAACALHTGRQRAACVHLKQAGRLYIAAGWLDEAGEAGARLGACEWARGRRARALSAWSRTAYALQVLGRDLEEAQVRLALGRCHREAHAHEHAIEEYERAVELACRTRQTVVEAEAHIGLALAQRARGDLMAERQHAQRAVECDPPARLRLRAESLVAAADLRSGAAGALRVLERLAKDLEASGLKTEADECLRLLFDARLRGGAVEDAKGLLRGAASSPNVKLGAARIHLVEGSERTAMTRLEELAVDATLPLEVRLSAYVHLADAYRRQGKLGDAREAAILAAALMEVRARNRMDDLRIHRVLARVFQEVGDVGRAMGHRVAARKRLRSLVRAATDAREGRRLARAQWRTDPTPELVSSVA